MFIRQSTEVLKFFLLQQLPSDQMRIRMLLGDLLDLDFWEIIMLFGDKSWINLELRVHILHPFLRIPILRLLHLLTLVRTLFFNFMVRVHLEPDVSAFSWDLLPFVVVVNLRGLDSVRHLSFVHETGRGNGFRNLLLLNVTLSLFWSLHNLTLLYDWEHFLLGFVRHPRFP